MNVQVVIGHHACNVPDNIVKLSPFISMCPVDTATWPIAFNINPSPYTVATIHCSDLAAIERWPASTVTTIHRFHCSDLAVIERWPASTVTTIHRFQLQ